MLVGFFWLPRWLSGRESAFQCRRFAGDLGLIPGLGRSPGEGNGNPLQYSCLENPTDRGAWQVTVHESQRVRHDWAIKQQQQDPFIYSFQIYYHCLQSLSEIQEISHILKEGFSNFSVLQNHLKHLLQCRFVGSTLTVLI